MNTSFRGKIELDIRNSKADWDAFLDPPSCLCVGCDSGDAVSSAYVPQFPYTNGNVVKVLFDVADDVYMDIEHRFAAALARD